MSTIGLVRLMAAVTAAMALGAASAMDSSRDTVGAIQVEGAWARALPAVARNGAAYMVIRNDGPSPDRIVGGDSAIAERVELHTHEMQGGLAKMRRLEGGIELPAGGSQRLEPGGMHVMLMGLAEPLVAGETFEIVLRFANAPPLAVEVTIRDAASVGHGGSDRGGTHGSMRQSGEMKKHGHGSN